MNKLRFLAFVTVLSSSLTAKSLQECSLIIWPQYNWIGSSIESVANDVYQDGDFLVYPSVWGMKQWFRSDDYQINPEHVLLHFEQAMPYPGFSSDLKKHQEGIGGLFVAESDSSIAFEEGKSDRRRFYDTLKKSDLSLVYCIDRTVASAHGNLSYLGRQCDQLLIYFDQALLVDPEKAVAYFKESCARAKSLSEGVKIIAGIKLKLEDSDIDEIIAILEPLASEIDGILVVFKGTSSQKSAAVKLIKRLRA